MPNFVASYNCLGVINLIYQRIRDLREDLDLNQQVLADYLHINRRTYSGYEIGARTIPPEILIEIAKFHNTSIDFLLGLTNVKEPYSRLKK